jgi:hypothetical protein
MRSYFHSENQWWRENRIAARQQKIRPYGLKILHTSCRLGMNDERYTLRLLLAPWLKRMMSVQC